MFEEVDTHTHTHTHTPTHTHTHSADDPEASPPSYRHTALMTGDPMGLRAFRGVCP